MTNTVVNTRLVPTAAALIGVVYDHGPDAVNAVLRRIPDTSRDELLVLLAAMVDPDRTPSELLAWTTAGPVKSRDGLAREEKTKPEAKKTSSRLPREHGTQRGYRQHVTRDDMPACKKCSAANREMEARRYAARKANRKASRQALEKVS